MKPKTSFTLTKRVTTDKLIAIYGEKVKNAQLEYVSKLNKATDFLENNYLKCKEMDSKLGVLSEVIDSSDDEPLEDDKLGCPIDNCRTKTSKLKRHLSKHNLSEDATTYAIQCSKEFSKNSKPTNRTRTSKRKSNTSMVSRKGNYKICPLCNRLFLNLTDHLQHIHKLSKTTEEYEKYLKNSEVVPRCYTKLVSGVATKLTGEDLENAKDLYEEEMETQKETLDKLKNVRNEIKTKTDSEIKETNEIRKHNVQRYGTRMTDTLTKWSTAFKEHLTFRGYSNPSRGVSMALEVLLANNAEEDTKIEQLLNVIYIRELLQEFKLKTSTSDTTKIKYLKCFSQLVHFLTTDASSPEHKEAETNEELIAKDIKLKKINYEIENLTSQLAKNRGSDLIRTRERAAKKLIAEDETDKIQKEIETFLNEFICKDEITLKNYNLEEIRKVRDSLITIATIRLARRSGEIISMTLEEYEQAEDVTVDDKPFKIIKVLNHKTSKTGKPALVSLSKEEYVALSLYIKHLRPKLGQTAVNNVFLTCSNQLCGPAPLNYSSLYKILQKFETTSGKKLSSRALRTSKITESRKRKLSQEDKVALAESMNHTLATAERNYNFKSPSESVVKVLSRKRSENTFPEVTVSESFAPPLDSSTPVKKRKEDRPPLQSSTGEHN